MILKIHAPFSLYSMITGKDTRIDWRGDRGDSFPEHSFSYSSIGLFGKCLGSSFLDLILRNPVPHVPLIILNTCWFYDLAFSRSPIPCHFRAPHLGQRNGAASDLGIQDARHWTQ